MGTSQMTLEFAGAFFTNSLMSLITSTRFSLMASLIAPAVGTEGDTHHHFDPHWLLPNTIVIRVSEKNILQETRTLKQHEKNNL
jgi:hypothetical protein